MDWFWPGFLPLLGLMPLLVAAYLWVLRRKRRFAVRYSSLSLIRAALPRSARWRRHLPFALFLLALTSLVLALARPVAIISVPTSQTTIILALDVSRSMLQDDIQPSRLAAAEDAARSFIQSQSPGTQIGIVAFAAFAEMIQPPTTDQEALEAAIDSLSTGRGTAIGSGILEAIDVIATIDPSVAPSIAEGDSVDPPDPVPGGAYAPAIIVLLTDGVATTGPAPQAAAQQAADRGVRVYTIGFGTERGSQHWGGPRGQFRRGIDEDTLKQVAELTGGRYYAAASADELQSVFRNVPTSLITRHETMELTVVGVALSVLLAASAMALSLRWNPLL
ncbi:MAG TPA: VWA domain-containing protein [Herpetosiphonaceae bacterium]